MVDFIILEKSLFGIWAINEVRFLVLIPSNKTEFMVMFKDIHDTKSNTLNFGQSLLFKVNADCQDQRQTIF